MASQRLRINRRVVPVIANQMIFDLSDEDLGVLVEEEKPKRIRPKCECGSWAVGVQNYMAGHGEYCPVNENCTPVMW